MVLENVEYSAILLEGYASSSLKYLNWYLCYLQYDHVVIICTEEIQMLIKKKKHNRWFQVLWDFCFYLGDSWYLMRNTIPYSITFFIYF